MTTTPRRAMLDDLARSGLTEGDARRMKVRPYTAAEAKTLGLTHAASGYVLPYFDLRGKTTKFFRYRLLDDIRTTFEKLAGASSPKYLQPPKTLNEVYMAPGVPWEKLLDSDMPLTITEGEKKAAAACKVGVATLGLGGVWNYQAAKAKLPLLPVLEKFRWSKRTVRVVFDSDAASNVDVRMAGQRLEERLKAKGADVRLGYVPATGGAKMGLDDYLLVHRAEELAAWLDALEPYDGSRVLHEMNSLVHYVRNPGLIYVLADGRKISPSQFKEHAFSTHRYTQVVEGKQGPKMREVDVPAEWLKWPGRAEVSELVFEPGQPRIINGALNMWSGNAIQPQKGIVDPWLRLIEFLFGKDVKAREWFERWCAYPFQYPGTKMLTAALLWGGARGTGKSLVGFTLKDLYGPKNAILIGDNELEKQDFNFWAVEKQFVFADEITGNNNRKLANQLKMMVTRETVNVNQKYVPAYTVRDCINYYFTSNDADAFYIDAGERRFFVHEVRAEKPLEHSFYTKVYEPWRRSQEGLAALMHYFLTLPLKDFDPRAAALETLSKRQMVALTRTELEAYIDTIKADPGTFLDRFGGGDLATIKELAAAFDAGEHRVSTVLMARKLKAAGLEHILPAGYTTPTVRLKNRDQVVFYALRNRDKWARAQAEVLRAHYEQHRPALKGKKP